MKEEVTTVDFYVCMRDIANNSFNLGEKMSEEKNCQKNPQVASK